MIPSGSELVAALFATTDEGNDERRRDGGLRFPLNALVTSEAAEPSRLLSEGASARELQLFLDSRMLNPPLYFSEELRLHRPAEPFSRSHHRQRGTQADAPSDHQPTRVEPLC